MESYSIFPPMYSLFCSILPFTRFKHVFELRYNAFIVIALWNINVYIYKSLFFQLTTDGHLCYFQSEAIMKIAAIHMCASW